jgi:hypothetical protein
MLTRRQVTTAIAKRNALAAEIQDYCRHLPFEKCFALCSPALREQYVAANRVACFMEEEIIARGSAYRLKQSANNGTTGGLVWRTKYKWAAGARR